MILIFYWCIIHLFMCVTYSQSENNGQRLFYLKNRLPKNIVPHFYNLQLLLPDFPNNFEYEGQVTIDFDVVAETDRIVLNVDGLVIYENKTALRINNITDDDDNKDNDDNNSNVNIVSQCLDTKRLFYNISTEDKLEVGKYSLDLYFQGKVRDDLFGFYRSRMKAGNETRLMAITQFSPINARRAFPCFDEPYLKAKFQLHIGHHDRYTVTSNTFVEKVKKTNIPNYIITSMAPTPKMSTYLFGWAIHDLEFSHLPNLPTFGIWTRKSMTPYTSSVLENSWSLYNALENWLNVTSPLEKMEQIAVSDFHFSGMENWGMIAFRESVPLHDEKITPTKLINHGLAVIGHEFSHSWFGNLITPEFWNVGWLKEGFSTYFGYFGWSLVYPDRKIMDLFIVENVQSALESDGVDHQRTMVGKNPGEAESVMDYLDFVSYSKGASIVRMIQCIMGEKIFQEAIRSYLTNRSYDFVTPEILYDHLRGHLASVPTDDQLRSNIDIGEVVATYANQVGYPVITITRNYSENSMEIRQERFYYQHSSSAVDSKLERWWIPLNLVSGSQRNSTVSLFETVWLSPSEEQTVMKVNIDPEDWLVCDINKAGYYRVNYDDGNWNMLISHLCSSGFNTIRPIGRATLIDDVFSLARGGYLHYAVAFRLANYLTQETEYEPWYTAVKSLNYLKQIFQDVPTLQDSLQRYVQIILEPIYSTLSFVKIGESQFRQKLLRNLILSTACEFRNPHCLSTAQSIFLDWIKNPSTPIGPDLKSFVYCAGIRSGNAEIWETVFSRFIEADLHTEKELLMEALGCTNNTVLINQLLEFAISDGTPDLPHQYRVVLITQILRGHPENVNHTLDFISKNFQQIMDARGKSFFDKIFNALKPKITNRENLKKLKNLLDLHNSTFANSATAKKTVTYAEETIKWIEKFLPIIADVLDQQDYHTVRVKKILYDYR